MLQNIMKNLIIISKKGKFQMKELTKLEEKIVLEMIHQGADNSTISGVLNDLKTKQQREEMMEYLISIRDMEIPKGEVLEKSME